MEENKKEEWEVDYEEAITQAAKEWTDNPREAKLLHDLIRVATYPRFIEALSHATKEAREDRDAEWMEIIKWLSGEVGEFPICPDGARYCWRTELRKKVVVLSPNKN